MKGKKNETSVEKGGANGFLVQGLGLVGRFRIKQYYHLPERHYELSSHLQNKVKDGSGPWLLFLLVVTISSTIPPRRGGGVQKNG